MQQPQLAPAPHAQKGFLHAQELTQEQSLREHLLHHVNDSNQAAVTSNQRVQGVPVASPTTPAHNIDPAIAGPGVMSHSPGESGGDDNGAGESKKGGKRELSTSKRAAQNRAAQRAFRQRKEGHIKKLEEQVRDAQQMAESFKKLEHENYTLREYIINLQSRLIDVQGDVPPAPSNINLEQPPPASLASPTTAAGAGGHAGPAVTTAPMAPMGGSDAMTHLQQSAARAVADLSREAREANTDPALVSKSRA